VSALWDALACDANGQRSLSFVPDDPNTVDLVSEEQARINPFDFWASDEYWSVPASLLRYSCTGTAVTNLAMALHVPLLLQEQREQVCGEERPLRNTHTW